jgi:hypothetical protein
MPAGDNQLEIEVTLRDSTSAVLKEIGRQLDTVTKKMVETGKTGQDAFNKVGDAAKRSQDHTKAAHTGLAGVSGAIGSINKVMMGTSGLIALFAGFTKVLGNFAAQRVQLQLLTTDIGFTTQQISVMKQVLAQKGITDEGEQKQIITGFGAQFKEAEMLGEFSPLFERFARYGNVDLGEKIVKSAKSQNFKQAMDLAAGEYDRLAKANPARARYYATVVLQTQESILQDWLKTQQGISAVQTSSYFESKEFLQKQEQIYNDFHTVVNKSLGAAITGILGIEKAYSNFTNSPVVSNFLVPKTDAQGNADVSMMPGVASEGGVMPSMPSPKQQNKTEGRATGGPAYAGRSYLVGERGPEMFSPSESGVVQASYTKSDANIKELTDSERESNKALKEIRDTLKQMEDDAFGTAASGGGGGTLFRPGIRGPGGGGGGGGTPGTPGPASLPLQAGDLPGSGRGSGGRFNVAAGTRPIGASESETVVLANGQKVTVNKRAASQFKGFFDDLIKAGAPVRSLGGVGSRGNPSQHPVGLAIDWAQNSRDVVAPDVQRWISQHPEVLNALEQKWGMSGGEHWAHPDTGHFSIDTLYGTEHLAKLGIAGGAASAPGAPGGLTAGARGAVDPGALHARLRELISGSKLAGYLPPDAAKYGFKTGSAEEWAGLMSGIAGRESGNKAGARGDSGGSHGLFQLSPQDAITYGIQKTPFTAEQLADPDFNARMAVVIAEKRALQGGVGGSGGMADYWAGHGKPTSYLAQGRVQAGKDTEEARKIMDEQSKSAARTGTVTASVDFGAMAKQQQERSSVFKVLKLDTARQNAGVHEGTVVAGDPGHSVWTP